MELAITISIGLVALATWDTFRRRYAARRVDDRRDLEDMIRRDVDALEAKATGVAKIQAERITSLENRVTQLQNRATPRRLNKL